MPRDGDEFVDAQARAIKRAECDAALRTRPTRRGRREGIGYLAAPDGSWCKITHTPDAAGHYTVREAEPTLLWATLDTTDTNGVSHRIGQAWQHVAGISSRH